MGEQAKAGERDRLRAESSSSGHSAAHAGGSYLLSVAFPAWISAFGPRPNFKIDSKQSREWLEWTDEGRHHGLAAFQVDAEGHVSARQWRRV